MDPVQQQQPQQRREELLTAVSNGNMELVDRLLGDHQYPTTTLQETMAAAAASKNIAMLDFCLDRLSMVPVTEDLLRRATDTGSPEILGKVLARDPSLVHQQFDKRGTPLLWAIWNHQPLDVVSLILSYGVDPNQDTGPYLKPVTYCAFDYGDTTEFLDLLLSHGAVLAHTHVLMAAAQFGHVKVIRYLLEHGLIPADDHPKYRLVVPALHTAIKYGQAEAMLVLLAAGADKDEKNWQGATAWDVAREQTDGAFLRLLEQN